MSGQFLQIPNSDNVIYQGSLVRLKRFPDITWILRYGWYKWDNRLNVGWNFLSVTDQTILPVLVSDLVDIVIVDNDDPIHRQDIPPKRISGEVPENSEYYPKPAYITEKDKERYDAAFISLETLEDRNELLENPVPNGKIVRVNELDKYFMWDSTNEIWNEVEFAFKSDLPKWTVTSSESTESDGE